MDELQPGSIKFLEPHDSLPFRQPYPNERTRLDALRLECLKLANSTEHVSLIGPEAPQSLIDTARAMFEFVTDAPKLPEPVELFVVRRTIEVTGCEPDRSHLSVSGNWLRWSYVQFAFRFVSDADARKAITKHASFLFGEGVIPRYEVEQLPAGTEIF